mmetsp:Transcript_6914/g.16636  ORF Transcript_6914/g.16636 Transcript_6914/m.16636 type:complete len:228 (-) Transcript_6914:787-1470(-)
MSNFSHESWSIEPPMDQTNANAKSCSIVFFSTSSSAEKSTPFSALQSDSKMKQNEVVRFTSTHLTGSLHDLRWNLMPIVTYFSTRLRRWSFMVCDIASGSLVIAHVLTVANQPRSVGVRYTTPMRLTVAGEATARSFTSKRHFISTLSLMRSPLARQRVMLSSSTVFMFSIQMASTGPLNIIHLRSDDWLDEAWRYMVDMMPSCHSRVFSSNWPYIWPIVIDLGFNW